MKKFFTLIFSIALMNAFGQSIPMYVVASAGGSGSSTNFSISWTLGEPVITTLTGTNIILTQGFQQGNLFGTNIPEEEFTSLNFKMYPNPAITSVKFEISNPEAQGDFIVEVFDITGRKVIHQNLGYFNNQDTKVLPVTSLKSGIYLVKVSVGNYQSDILKFIKE